MDRETFQRFALRMTSQLTSSVHHNPDPGTRFNYLALYSACMPAQKSDLGLLVHSVSHKRLVQTEQKCTHPKKRHG